MVSNYSVLIFFPMIFFYFINFFVISFLATNVSRAPSSASTLNSHSSNASSIFRSAVQNTGSVFSQPSLGNVTQNANSIFGQANNAGTLFSQANRNIFGQNQLPGSDAGSIFASASQQFFGAPTRHDVFSPPASPQTGFNVFQKANTYNQNSFEQNVFQNSGPQIQNVFNQNNASNMFSEATINESSSDNQSRADLFLHQNNMGSNVFSQANIFGDLSNGVKQEESDDVYSKLENLSEEDLSAFKSDEFKLGFIPELPPPRSLCV